MSNLTPIDPPSLQPLAGSFEENQLETELKKVFVTVFERLVRERERALNLYGMAHLGGDELVARSLYGDGLAVIRRDAERVRFLLKSWRARNPKRGMLFLRTYLQTIWPNEWSIDQFWHPIATALEYPAHKTPNGNPETHFLTSRVRVGVTVEADDGTGLVAMQKALRSTLAARLVLELVLNVSMENVGETGLALASGAAGSAPLYTEGKLIASDVVTSPLPILLGAVIGMPVNFRGSMRIPHTHSNGVSINDGAGIEQPVNLIGSLTQPAHVDNQLVIADGMDAKMPVYIVGKLRL